MFYRYNKLNCRIPMDLDGAYGGSCFLAGGHPSLMDENLALLNQPGVMVMAMNNTASVLPRCDFWIGADKPMCYSPRILKDPRMMKFAMISRRNILAHDIDWKFIPNTYFFGTTEKWDIHNFLNFNRDFVWWKNTFYIAMQLLYRLGFRKIYLVGCKFDIEGKKQYAYDTKLDKDAVNWNKRTYNQVVENMIKIKSHFEQKDLELISCTPGSPLNEHFKTMSFEEAVEDTLKDFPREYSIDKCVHSSFFTKEEKK